MAKRNSVIKKTCQVCGQIFDGKANSKFCPLHKSRAHLNQIKAANEYYKTKGHKRRVEMRQAAKENLK